MKPFKLVIDWTCQEAYGDPVTVELHVMGQHPKVLRRFEHGPDAAGWARKWLADRGFNFFCDIDTAQRQGWTHITLHAVPAQIASRPTAPTDWVEL